ncbi:MAG: NAD(P)H-dependent oxidoreductase [Verrucomicrobiae bacterium]|nr:NAD(P)H-dependent oxidoreductase [Verrucomicrobiae bacterium]
MVRILAFAGSTRRDSYNKKLIAVGVEGAKKAGAEVTLIDLRDFPLPLYDGDLEQEKGLPPNAAKLRDLLKSHAGLLIASPEYNSSITGVLKNTIDWTTRSEEKEGTLDAYHGKVAGLLSASPGGLGGLRGLVHVRAILGNIGVLVIPEQSAVSSADEAFDENGALRDAKKAESVRRVGARLAELLKRI